MSDYDFLRDLIALDSPTGFTRQAGKYVHEALSQLDLEPHNTTKGAVRCALGPEPRLALAAHIDTLGAMVSEIKDDGTLAISPLGGLSLNMAEGEYVNIHTLEGPLYTGTFLLDNPSAHVNKELGSKKRTLANMHVRLDEIVSSKKDVEALGIRNGDIISFDPRYQELSSGFIKSRFLDNKAGCHVLYEVARQLRANDEKPAVELFFSNYEEVGHGGTCGYSSGIEELLVIDMGVIGTSLDGTERRCSICAKDSSGPYDYSMRSKLVRLAEEGGIPFALDVYPYYGSDGSAALRAGNDFRVALIGPGVAASHGVERTHTEGIEATVELCLAYIRSQT